MLVVLVVLVVRLLDLGTAFALACNCCPLLSSSSSCVVNIAGLSMADSAVLPASEAEPDDQMSTGTAPFISSRATYQRSVLLDAGALPLGLGSLPAKLGFCRSPLAGGRRPCQWRLG